MENEQLGLEEVKAQFLEAESRLVDVSKELQGISSTRDSLESVGQSLTGVAEAMTVTAGTLANLTDELSSATRAIEDAEPGAVMARLNEQDGQFSRLVEDLGGLSKSLAQTRILVLLTLLVALAGIAVAFIR